MADINQPNFIRLVLVAILLHIINVIVMNVQYYYIVFVTQRKTRCDENSVINIRSKFRIVRRGLNSNVRTSPSDGRVAK